jgi:uridine monophosphate synthetase
MAQPPVAPVSAAVEAIMLQLHDIGAVKFGEFKLKSGLLSPIYIDLRMIISFPALLAAVSDSMHALLADARFDVVCGVPYTALPIATVMSIKHSLPMVMRRKEAKDYGTKKLIEGVFTSGQQCLVIEDLVTSGLSVLETVAPLKEAGLDVADVVVLIDRQQGGRANLERHGLRLHSVLTIAQALDVLLRHQRIDAALAKQVTDFLAAAQVPPTESASSSSSSSSSSAAPAAAPAAPAASETGAVDAVAASAAASASDLASAPHQSYEARAALCTNALTARLFRIMEAKRTNLCVALDVTASAQLLALADAIGPHICVLKTHADVLADFEYDSFVPQLRALADKHNFLIFEDRKFADIGNTVQLQFASGVHRIADWAHVVNAHALPGAGIVKGLASGIAGQRQAGKNRDAFLAMFQETCGAMFQD